jgi:hypothetical protein
VPGSSMPSMSPAARPELLSRKKLLLTVIG